MKSSQAITEELCRQEFSASSILRASSISAINQRLDEELECFMCRRLEEEYPYLLLGTRYEKEGSLEARFPDPNT